MTRIKKLTLAALTALALVAGAAASVPAQQLAGDPSQWGVEAKVNEYEGQHRIAGDPSQWGQVAKKGSFDITELDGEAVAKVNEYEGQHRVALNFTKIETKG